MLGSLMVTLKVGSEGWMPVMMNRVGSCGAGEPLPVLNVILKFSSSFMMELVLEEFEGCVCIELELAQSLLAPCS